MDDLTTAKRELLQATRTLKATVDKRIARLADAITLVNAKTQRAGTTIGPVPIGSTDVAITWDRPWPDTAYMVAIELITGTAALGALHATLKVGSKTLTDCVITVNTTAAVASVGVDILGVRT